MFNPQKENIHETPLRSSKYFQSERLNLSKISRPGSIHRTTLNPYKESTGKYFQASQRESYPLDPLNFDQKLALFEKNMNNYVRDSHKKYSKVVKTN